MRSARPLDAAGSTLQNSPLLVRRPFTRLSNHDPRSSVHLRSSRQVPSLKHVACQLQYHCVAMMDVNATFIAAQGIARASSLASQVDWALVSKATCSRRSGDAAGLIIHLADSQAKPEPEALKQLRQLRDEGKLRGFGNGQQVGRVQNGQQAGCVHNEQPANMGLDRSRCALGTRFVACGQTWHSWYFKHRCQSAYTPWRKCD